MENSVLKYLSETGGREFYMQPEGRKYFRSQSDLIKGLHDFWDQIFRFQTLSRHFYFSIINLASDM